jgi:hypothetical protein
MLGAGPRMPNPQQPNMGFGNNSDFRPPSAGGMSNTGTEMLRKQLEQVHILRNSRLGRKVLEQFFYLRIADKFQSSCIKICRRILGCDGSKSCKTRVLKIDINWNF